jgi:hypothetical protein
MELKAGKHICVTSNKEQQKWMLGLLRESGLPVEVRRWARYGEGYINIRYTQGHIITVNKTPRSSFSYKGWTEVSCVGFLKLADIDDVLSPCKEIKKVEL